MVNIAVIGTGYWGKNLVRNFSELGNLVAVYDNNEETSKKFAKEYNIKSLAWNEILEDESIQAVAIATPAVTHAQYAKEAILAGKDVFIEKPLALTLEDANEVVQLAKKHKAILMVGHLLQYHPAYQKLRTFSTEGKLGKLEYIYSNRLNFGKFRQEEDILWSFAPHDISMILGLVNQAPETVQAIGSYFLHRTTADVTTTHLSFPNGVNAHIFVSWLHPFKQQKLVVVGTNGMAVFDDSEPWERKLIIYPHEVQWKEGVPIPAKADAEYIELEQSEPLQNECQHFVDCVANRKRPLTDGQEGIQVLTILQNASLSLNQQQPIKVKEKKPFFVHETAIVDAPAKIGKETKIWHFSHILGNTTIGKACNIGQNVMIGPDVTIGSNCKIQNNVSIYKGVTLEDNVFCGPSCVFTNVLTPRANVERKDEFEPTYVEEGVSIGANATIICGSRIGKYALIGAGAVVTKDVPAHALVVGNPAKQIGWVSHAGERLDDDNLVCPRNGTKYYVNNDNQLEELPHDSIQIKQSS